MSLPPSSARSGASVPGTAASAASALSSAAIFAHGDLSISGAPSVPQNASPAVHSGTNSAASAGGPAAPVATPVSSPGVTRGQRCAGIEYANMKKEEAREEYKERRRRELLNLGEIERVKRRKKNDASMSDDQKYHRRLKMNQDSAAAARAAQDAYVSTLEKLVETAEAEKGMLALEATNLRQERDELATRLNALHQQVVGVLPVGEGGSSGGAGVGADAVEDMPSSALLLRKMMELFDVPEVNAAMTNDAEFARGMLGMMPAPAV